MRKLSIAFAVLVLVLLGVSQVTADPIPVVNTTASRPITSFDSNPPQPSLQSLLDQIAGVNFFDAVASQNPTAIWSAAALPPNTVVVPVLSFEFDPEVNPSTGEFGLFSGTTTSQHLEQVFAASDLPSNDPNGPYRANVVWSNSDSGNITVYNSTGAQVIRTAPFTAIPYTFFGFYAKGDSSTGPVTVFSSDLLSGDTVHSLAYDGSSFWVVAFEYQSPTSGTYDFNDLVIKIESIQTAVPEPATLLLVGFGLGIASLVARRRASK